ncbi:hypothetical protein KIN20_000019 [Parelaphostrongylus tenuis]|uniref:Uncharacterized protein n=1 Tax=Parelaphostrongylus tenuis TaxID=148309 RepID=A0AAD5QFT7_PARTN|nr:hypothetical protein KIN20_000019 [Parelaphostrongylus tenuis]
MKTLFSRQEIAPGEISTISLSSISTWPTFVPPVIVMHSAYILLLVPLAFSKSIDVPQLIPPCPAGSRPLLRMDGEPRKCLPHQNSLCVNALPDKHNATTVCCYNNQVDYFCCLDTTPQQCPDYEHVMVVIYNSVPQNPFGLRSFIFRDGIEDEVIDATMRRPEETLFDNGIRQEDGFLVRHNNK